MTGEAPPTSKFAKFLLIGKSGEKNEFYNFEFQIIFFLDLPICKILVKFDVCDASHVILHQKN